jgi:hypothetical protein
MSVIFGGRRDPVLQQPQRRMGCDSPHVIEPDYAPDFVTRASNIHLSIPEQTFD